MSSLEFWYSKSKQIYLQRYQYWWSRSAKEIRVVCYTEPPWLKGAIQCNCSSLSLNRIWLFLHMMVQQFISFNQLNLIDIQYLVPLIRYLTVFFFWRVQHESLVNTNSFYTNFTNAHFPKVPIPHLTHTMKQKFLQ